MRKTPQFRPGIARAIQQAGMRQAICQHQIIRLGQRAKRTQCGLKARAK